MINPHWSLVVIPMMFGLMLAAGVWLCFWWQRIGWTVTLAANLLLISYGAWTGQWGFSIAVPLAAAAQVHHLYRSRREPWTGRRVPASRASGQRTRRRIFRHEAPLRYRPGRAPVTPTAAPMIAPATDTTIERVVGVACPCGCGAFAPSDFVAHLERNRGNLNHWAVANRK